MGPDMELKGRPAEMVMEASNNNNKGNGNILEKCATNDVIQCASNYEDNTFEMDEHFEEPQRVEDMDVNIVDSTNSGETPLLQGECHDTTESSSSFSGSGIGDGGMLSDAEVMSELRGDDTPVFSFNGFGDLFRKRKKKVTSHWRTYIQPLMWRCKWVELKIKYLQSQARKYDTVIAEINQRKMQSEEVEKLKSEGIGAKSLPFPNERGREKVMKRKKRKRVEDTVDTAAYMSQHNIFAYYETRRRSFADAILMDNDLGNQAILADSRTNVNNEFAVNDESLALRFRDGDDSMEQILWKIGVAQSHVIAMKTRLNKVTSENAARLSSLEKLSSLVPCSNGLNNMAQTQASSPTPDGFYLQPKLEPNMGEMVMPASAVSSYGEVSHIPDIGEPTDQHQAGALCENTKDTYNRRAKEEVDNIDDVKIKPVETVHLPKQEPLETADPPVDLLTDDQSTPKIRSISKITAPKIKRKRGRRKAGSGLWSRKTSVQTPPPNTK